MRQTGRIAAPVRRRRPPAVPSSTAGKTSHRGRQSLRLWGEHRRDDLGPRLHPGLDPRRPRPLVPRGLPRRGRPRRRIRHRRLPGGRGRRGLRQRLEPRGRRRRPPRGAGSSSSSPTSFQRIFQENLVYTGMPFTTDLGVVDRLEAGEDVDTGGLRPRTSPPSSRPWPRHGGLLPYAHALLAGEPLPYADERAPTRPLNLPEKILAGAPSPARGSPTAWRAWRRATRSSSAPGLRGHARVHHRPWSSTSTARPSATPRVHDPAQVVAAFEDHFVLLSDPTVPEARHPNARLAPAQRLTEQQRQVCRDLGLRLHGPGPRSPTRRASATASWSRTTRCPATSSCSPTPTAPPPAVLNAFAFGVGSRRRWRSPCARA